MEALEKVIQKILPTISRGSVKLNELKISIYSDKEIEFIKLELIRLGVSRHENFDELFINEIINSFKELNYSFKDVILRIKVAKITKRFGNYTTLSDFTDCNEDLYSKKYTEIYEVIEYCENCNYENNLGIGTTTLQDYMQLRREHSCVKLMSYKYK